MIRCYKYKDWDQTYFLQLDYNNPENRYLYNKTKNELMDVIKNAPLATEISMEWKEITDQEFEKETDSKLHLYNDPKWKTPAQLIKENQDYMNNEYKEDGEVTD